MHIQKHINVSPGPTKAKHIGKQNDSRIRQSSHQTIFSLRRDVSSHHLITIIKYLKWMS